MPKKVTTKPWYLSRTLYFNAITLTLGIVDVVAGLGVVDPSILALVMGVGNVLLRFVTEYKLTK